MVAGFGLPLRLPSEAAAYAAAVEQLQLPSPCTKLPGAYLNVLPGASPGEVLLTVMPVDPKTAVSGEISCGKSRVRIDRTNALAIYRVGRRSARRVF